MGPSGTFTRLRWWAPTARSKGGVSEIQDFMPVGGSSRRLIRRVIGVRGSLRFRLEVQPRFEYGRHAPKLAIVPTGAVFRARGQAISLASPIALDPSAAGDFA